MTDPQKAGESERVRELAHSLDCWLVEDICLLYGINEGTAEAWRKRGTGPAHIQAANRPLYPKQGVADDLRSRKRERRGGVAPKDLL